MKRFLLALAVLACCSVATARTPDYLDKIHGGKKTYYNSHHYKVMHRGSMPPHHSFPSRSTPRTESYNFYPYSFAPYMPRGYYYTLYYYRW